MSNTNIVNYMLQTAFHKATDQSRQDIYTATRSLTILTAVGEWKISKGTKLSKPFAEVLFIHEEEAGVHGLYLNSSTILGFNIGDDSPPHPGFFGR